MVAARSEIFAEEVRSPNELKTLTLEELLDTKVISGTRTLEKWKTTAAAITVVPDETIHALGAVRLAEVLRFAPGLNVSRSTGSSYAVSARGFSSAAGNKLQVMMDGRSLYTPLLSGVFWEVQDTVMDDLERIEVVRGPGATLWGSNAVNGVINIVTKNARDTQGGLLTVASGSEEKSRVVARYGGKAGDNTYYRTYFKYQSRDAQILANGSDAQDGMQQRQGGFRIDSTPPGDNQVTFQGDLYGNTFGVSGRPDARSSGGNLLGRWTHAFSPNAVLQVQTYYDHARRDVPLQFRENRDTYDLDVQHHFEIGNRNTLVLGGGYRSSTDETDQNGRTLIFVPPNRTLKLTRFFAQDEVALVPAELALTIGSTIEHNDYSGWEVQPTARLGWKASDRQFLWAAVSRAVRAPTRVDTDTRFLPSPASGFVVVQGTPDFAAEKVLAYELGWRVQPSPKWFFDLATFYNDYRDLRTLEPSGATGFPLLVRNEREGHTYGAEAVVTYQAAEHWRLSANLNYFYEDLHYRPGSRDTSGSAVETNDPAWIARLESVFDVSSRWEVGAVLRYVAELPRSPVPAYTTLDLRVAFHAAKNWEVAVVGQNLLQASHAEFNPATKVQRGFYGQVSFRY